MKLAPICISQNGHAALPPLPWRSGEKFGPRWLERNLFVEQGGKKNTRRRGQTVKGLSGIHLLTCSRCAWLMSSSFGGEHMSTAAVPPSIGGDCARANCIPGSPAKSGPSELSHFLKRASAFHLIYMSHSPQNQRPFTVRTNRWLPGLMRSSFGCGSFLSIRGRCATAVTHFPEGAALVLLTPLQKTKRLIPRRSVSGQKLLCFIQKSCIYIVNSNTQLFQRKFYLFCRCTCTCNDNFVLSSWDEA